MDRSEINERSPLRVFERSTRGGLGRGNVGVVAARPGVGKTPFLVQLALDELMRGRRVLHVSHEHAVDHVRSYYDELFHDLAEAARLPSPELVRLDIERHRQIYSLLASAKAGPPSMRGGQTSVSRILETVQFARDVAAFEPDVVIIDGFDMANAAEEAMRSLAQLARGRSIELWVAAGIAEGAPASGLPASLAPLEAHVAVVLVLEAERDQVRLRLAKEHDTPREALVDLHLALDPHSMQILDTLPKRSSRPLDPRRFRLLSGGAKGAEAEFGACAEKWGMTEVNYSFEGHRLLERRRGVVVLADDDLKKGDFSLVYASKRLGRVLSEIPLVRSVLQSIWHQINGAGQVFCIGSVQDDSTVRGGTGWGVELARLWKKPVYVFDQAKKGWYRWSGTAWEMASPPVISRENFAGIGTQDLTDDGRKAIYELFYRSFGDPS